MGYEKDNRKKYEGVVQELTDRKSGFKPYVLLLSSNLSAFQTDIEAPDLKGEAYSLYLKKAQKWCSNLRKQKDAYERLMGELDTCIANAQKKVEYWRRQEELAKEQKNIAQ